MTRPPDGVLRIDVDALRYLVASRVGVSVPVEDGAPTGRDPMVAVDLVIGPWEVVETCLHDSTVDPVTHPKTTTVSFFAEPDILPSIIAELQAAYRTAQELRR